MITRSWKHCLLGGIFLIGTVWLRAQEPPPGPPPGPDAMSMEGGPGGSIGGRMEILGFGEMHPGKVVTGAPYSAVAVTESQQTLADGNTINRKVQSNVFRDSQGRVRRETTLPGVGPLAASGQPRTFVMIHDPVASTAYVLHPDTKIAEQLPSRGTGQGPKGQVSGSGGALQDKFSARMQQEIADGTLKKEDLGTQTINGISAQGTRFTRTIPAGQIGNNKAIVITNERWYSSDLQVVVKSVHSDPRQGQSTYTLTNIQRQEPAASLFTVPSDYTVQQAKHGGPHGMGFRKGGPAAADVPPPAPAGN
jgi:hypothetical protein